MQRQDYCDDMFFTKDQGLVINKRMSGMNELFKHDEKIFLLLNPILKL